VQKTKLKGLAALFLVANSISWFILTFIVIGNLAESYPLSKILSVVGSYFLALVGSAIIGGTLLYKKLRMKIFLLTWVLVGVVTCLFYAFTLTSSLSSEIAASVGLGASVGIGIPTCFSFFADQTRTEGRGKTGAATYFSIQLISVIIIFLTLRAGAEGTFLVLAVWRLLGIAGILFYQPLKTPLEERETSSLSIIKERIFILYFVSWLLFALVNSIEAPVVQGFLGGSYNSYLIAATLISCFSALISGVFCDLKGRKVVGILGFVVLGLGYAFLSFLSGGATKEIGQILYTICDGTAWGILYTIFVFVIWGDQSEGRIREKYYLWGSMPFLISSFISILVYPFASNIPVSTSFPLASFFLFIAVLPLIYAPETLSEKSIKDRDLKSYAEKALKQASKQSKKTKDEDADDANEENKESAEVGQPPGYDEARKLAEKYY